MDINFVEYKDFLGAQVKEIPCIVNRGVPSVSTVGAVGLLYMDSDTGEIYKCTSASDGVYIWTELAPRNSSESTPGQSVELDTTLTQSGKAADAKATGDEIRRVEDKIPNIEGLAKTEDIPTKPEDIGAQPKGNYLTEAPVISVNGKTGAVQLSASDVDALPSTYTPPNQTAKQVGADPKGTAASAVSAHNTNLDAHNDLRLAVQKLQAAVDAFMDVDDTTRDSLSEVLALIDANADVIESITTGKVSVSDIIDNLTTNVANKPLSAAQGVALKALIDGLSSGKLDASKLQEAINTALAQAKASGAFDGKPGQDGEDGITPHIGGNGNWYIGSTDTGIKAQGPAGAAGRGIKSIARTSGSGAAGTTDTYTVTYTDGTTITFTVRNGSNGTNGKTPVLGTDYFTPDDKAEIIQSVIDQMGLMILGQMDGENTITLTESLPDGTYTLRCINADGSTTELCEFVVGEPGPAYTNQIKISTDTDGSVYNGTGFKEDAYISSSDGSIGSRSGIRVTGFIPIKKGDVVRMQDVGFVMNASNASDLRFATYNSSKQFLKFVNASNTYALVEANGGVTNSDNELVEFTINGENTLFVADAAYMRICTARISADSIITINEPIV